MSNLMIHLAASVGGLVGGFLGVVAASYAPFLASLTRTIQG